MSKDSGKAEPSMDDILASIRRIIDEDGSKTRKPAAASGGKSTSDILDLTEMVNEDGSVTSLEKQSAAAPAQSKLIDDDEPPIYADREERVTVLGATGSHPSDSGRRSAGAQRPAASGRASGATGSAAATSASRSAPAGIATARTATGPADAQSATAHNTDPWHGQPNFIDAGQHSRQRRQGWFPARRPTPPRPLSIVWRRRHCSSNRSPRRRRSPGRHRRRWADGRWRTWSAKCCGRCCRTGSIPTCPASSSGWCSRKSRR